MLETGSTRIARESAVLVIIDIQQRLAAAMSRREQVVLAAEKLVRAASVLGIPVIVTRQNPEGLGGTVEALEEVLLEVARDGARVLSVDKMTFCCGEEHEFRDALVSTGRRQVVLAGMETHICVAQTAIALAEEGFQVHVAGDACCARSEEHHALALDRMRHVDVIVTTSESVIYEAVGRAGTDDFRQVLKIIKT